MYKSFIVIALFGACIGLAITDEVVEMQGGNFYPVQQTSAKLSDVEEEMSVGECTNLDHDNLLYNETLKIPSRTRLASSLSYTSTFNSRAQEIIYCIKWTPGQDSKVTYSGGLNSASVTFTLTAPAGKNGNANYLVYGN